LCLSGSISGSALICVSICSFFLPTESFDILIEFSELASPFRVPARPSDLFGGGAGKLAHRIRGERHRIYREPFPAALLPTAEQTITRGELQCLRRSQGRQRQSLRFQRVNTAQRCTRHISGNPSWQLHPALRVRRLRPACASSRIA